MKTWLREAKFLIEYAIVWPVVFLVRSASDRSARRLGQVIARVASWVLVKDRKWAYKNLDLIFGDQLSPAEKRRIVRSSFETIVQTRIESLRWTKEWMIENVIEEGGDEARAHVRRLKSEGRGAIVITAHLGNYELLPAWCHYTGFTSTVMYRPQDNWRVERLILGARHEYLPQVVQRNTTGLMTLAYILQEREAVGLLIDMNTLDNPVFVDYLGYQAASPPGAAALALSTNAAVFLAIAIRAEDGRHRLVFLPPFETIRTGNKKKDIQANTQQYMTAIESYVLAYPELYNWPHPRWRYRPDGSFWTADQPTEELTKDRQGPPRSRQQDPTPERVHGASRSYGERPAA